MAVVLVPGATGSLGRVIVPALQAAGHDVRAMTRTAGRVSGATEVVADVLDLPSLSAAMQGIDVVLHLASSPRENARSIEVDGTLNLLTARNPGTPLVYLSIVGCDRTPLGYYRAKAAAEELVRAATDGYVVRATQFHSFATSLCKPLPGIGRSITPKGALVQPVAESFVAQVLVAAVDDPAGAPTEVGGPERLDLAEVARRVHGRRALTLPLPGRFGFALRQGTLCTGPGALLGGPPI